MRTAEETEHHLGEVGVPVGGEDHLQLCRLSGEEVSVGQWAGPMQLAAQIQHSLVTIPRRVRRETTGAFPASLLPLSPTPPGTDVA